MGRLGESYFKEEREELSPGLGDIEEDEMDRDNSDLFGEEEEQDDMAGNYSSSFPVLRI